MDTPALMKRRRPGKTWGAIEFSVTAPFLLLLVTVAWFNDPRSLGRLALMLIGWSIAAVIIWRAIHAHRRHRAAVTHDA